jgi:hypothetical protein
MNKLRKIQKYEISTIMEKTGVRSQSYLIINLDAVMNFFWQEFLLN